MILRLRILVVTLLLVTTAASAEATINVNLWDIGVYNDGTNVESMFHLCVSGDITGVVVAYGDDAGPPNENYSVASTYDPISNSTAIVWQGYWPPMVGQMAHFTVHTNLTFGWSVIDSGWGPAACDGSHVIGIDPTLNGVLGPCALSFVNNSPFDLRVNSTGVLPVSTLVTDSSQFLGADFTTIGTNLLIPAGGMAEIFTQPASFWGVTNDTALVLSGTGSLWCGTYFRGDPGYGNNWNQTATYTEVVADPSVSTSVGWSFMLRQDLEPAYDNVYVEYNAGGTWQVLQAYSGSGTEMVDLNFVMLGADYVGPGADEIQLRVRLASDGGFSDEDGQWPTAKGACQIDDVIVTASASGPYVEGFESGNSGSWVLGAEAPGPPATNKSIATVVDYCGAAFEIGYINMDWISSSGQLMASQQNYFGLVNGALSAVSPVVSPARSVSAYPNPFNPSTKISYSLAVAEHVDLAVYNLAGAHVVTLVAMEEGAGDHEVTWLGRDATGRAVPSGVYMIRLKSAHKAETMNVVLIK